VTTLGVIVRWEVTVERIRHSYSSLPQDVGQVILTGDLCSKPARAEGGIVCAESDPFTHPPTPPFPKNGLQARGLTADI
jgi:hypothetical protein